MTYRADPAALAFAKRGATELVEGWPNDVLASAEAVARLGRAWGLDEPAARRIVTAERNRRGLPA